MKLLHSRRRTFLPVARLSLLLALVMLALLAAPARGQGGVGSTRGLPDTSSGIHTIEGRVLLPSGRRADRGVLVRLSSSVLISRSASTDADGVFTFNALPQYRITVEGGPEYASVSKSITIYGTTEGTPSGRMGQKLMLEVMLQPKDGAAVDEQTFAGVPAPAVEAFRKGIQFAQAGDSKKAAESQKELETAVSNGKGEVAMAHRYLGGIYWGQKDHKRAADELETYLKLEPKASDAERIREAIKELGSKQ